MKKQNIQDERVVVERRKISSEAYGILMVVLLLSILIQEFLLNAPFEQYAVEVICFFGISIYMTIRSLTLGLNIFGEGNQTKNGPLFSSIVTGIIVTTINGVLNYTKYIEHYKDNIVFFIMTLIVTFISTTFFIFAVLSWFNYLNKRRQTKIQKLLDKNEESE